MTNMKLKDRRKFRWNGQRAERKWKWRGNYRRKSCFSCSNFLFSVVIFL